EGCVLIHQLDEYLFHFGFERVYLDNTHHPTWGDAFYLKRGRLAVSCLGKIGRFANQLFQIAFVKCYAKDHYLDVETPAWDGQFLFGHSDPPVTPGLPLFKENVWTFTEEHSKILSLTNPLPSPLRNVDVWGYFQYPTKYYLPHQDSIRQLFKPVPVVEAKMQLGLDRLCLQNKTLVGLHLRRGDYQGGNSFPCFYAAPSQWYLEWLEGFWDTLDNPVLYIASDDLESVLPDFEHYQPMTAESLGLSLPEAPYYPDFYVLTQCHVLAISNSSFSVMASMLNEKATIFVRPHADLKALIPFDPWNCQVLWTPPSYQGDAYQE
ncbi:MAG: alpha-1,2-fucosyltransferase, partial [Cyanobacteria bacterium]|nr:alpha-1,2-fucosyltransferase [Cyanobacteriota bacterium]